MENKSTCHMTNEKRLIDANTVYKMGHRTPFHIGIADLCDLKELLADVPSVDAVEVVRCKDCKHWFEETSWCTKHSHFVGFDGMACHPSQSSEWKMFDEDDFCSYGERRKLCTLL